MELTPRLVSLLALLAVVPAVVFVVVGAELVAAVTVINVVLIAGSLALALSPHESDHDETTDSRPNGQ